MEPARVRGYASAVRKSVDGHRAFLIILPSRLPSGQAADAPPRRPNPGAANPVRANREVKSGIMGPCESSHFNPAATATASTSKQAASGCCSDAGISGIQVEKAACPARSRRGKGRRRTDLPRPRGSLSRHGRPASQVRFADLRHFQDIQGGQPIRSGRDRRPETLHRWGDRASGQRGGGDDFHAPRWRGRRRVRGWTTASAAWASSPTWAMSSRTCERSSDRWMPCCWRATMTRTCLRRGSTPIGSSGVSQALEVTFPNVEAAELLRSCASNRMQWACLAPSVQRQQHPRPGPSDAWPNPRHAFAALRGDSA